MRKLISTSNAPTAIGPYSQAVLVDNQIFVSGQIPLKPDDALLVGDTIEEQTKQVLKNLTEILKAAGFELQDVVKTTCYLKDMNQFAAMNEVYNSFFGEILPARVTVEVSRLPKDVLIEIDAIALKGYQ